MTIPNLQDYKTKKAKGLISLQKIDAENTAIAAKQFSVEDGKELPMQVLGVTIQEIDRAIADKKIELAELEAFRTDLIAAV